MPRRKLERNAVPLTAEDERATVALGLHLLDLDPDEVAAAYTTAPLHVRQGMDEALAHPAILAHVRGRRYVNDPVAWLREVAREHPWSQQRAIAEAVRDHPQVAVPTATTVGKTWLAARILAWWIDSHPPGSALALTTAATFDQVKGYLWKELRRVHARAELAGRLNLTEWYVAGELVAVGRKPADNNPAALQGAHEEFLLVIMDEADGLAAPLFNAATDALATTERGRVLAIGNPMRAEGPFFDACEKDPDWHVIRISAFDTPTFTGEKVPDRVGRQLVSKTYVAKMARKWGEDSPMYLGRVLGKAPRDNPGGVIPWSALQASIVHDPDDGRVPVNRSDTGRLLGYRWSELPDLPEWGVDVAAGGDKTVVWERRGRFLCRRWAVRSDDADVQVAGLRQRAAEWGCPTSIKVDATGLGWGLLAPLRKEAKDRLSPLHGAHVEAVQFGAAGEKPGPESPGWRNVRDGLWWRGRTLAQEDGWDLRTLRSPEHAATDPDLEDEVVSELADPTWDALGAGGRIRVEAKDHTKSRLGRSPDDADAILLAFWAGRPRRAWAPNPAALAAPGR